MNETHGLNEHLRDSALELIERIVEEVDDDCWESQKDAIGIVVDMVWWQGWHEGWAACRHEWELEKDAEKRKGL